jgi:class 3 adenylate cyclase
MRYPRLLNSKRFRWSVGRSSGRSVASSVAREPHGELFARVSQGTEGVRPLDLKVRAGLHTGECELIGEKVGGIAVHMCARVAARPGSTSL